MGKTCKITDTFEMGFKNKLFDRDGFQKTNICLIEMGSKNKLFDRDGLTNCWVEMGLKKQTFV